MAEATTEENEFGKELADAFAADEAAEAPITAPVVDPPKDDDIIPPVEEPKKDDPATPEDPNKKEDPATPPADPEKKPEDGTTPPEDPETPGEPEAPQPLTKDDLTSAIKDLQIQERTSSQALATTTKDVVDAYYPDGLSNVLVDERSGKELRTPADVVAASNGEMSTEDAAQWLLNEQYKLDQNINKIKSDAQAIAETTINFKRDSVVAIEKYAPLFKAYPHLQSKTFEKLMKQVKADEAKNVILSAPDVIEFYDDMLEPYKLAYEFGQKQPATAAVTPPTPPAPVTPGVGDRMDEGGDGGASPVDDPNDFAQQVTKELAKGL